MTYLDTSVLVAYYCPEAFSAKAEKLITGSSTSVVSSLTEVEFCSALSLKTRTGEMNVKNAKRVLSLFRAHLADGEYRIVPIATREYATACEWLSEFSTPLRTADALHIAAAFSNDLPILTADKDMAKSAHHFGVKCTLVS